jgi:hypothetical protein
VHGVWKHSPEQCHAALLLVFDISVIAPNREMRTFVRYVRYGTGCRLLPNYLQDPELPLRQKEFSMANSRTDELRSDLNRLLKMQTEVLESRTFGAATDTEIVEFEIRREVIQEICKQLANSSSV